MTSEEKKEIVEQVYNKLQPELEHFKNNVSNQIKSIYSQLKNNSDAAEINYFTVNKKLDDLLFTLVGNDLDKENSFFARFKKVEAFLDVIKEKKSFIIGSWAGITTIISIAVGILYAVINIVHFFKGTK